LLLSSFFWSSYARDLMLTDGRPLIGRAYEFFQRGNLLLLGADQLLLLFDLYLLFLNRIDQNNADSVVVNTLDFTFVVVSYKQRFDAPTSSAIRPTSALLSFFQLNVTGRRRLSKRRPGEKLFMFFL